MVGLAYKFVIEMKKKILYIAFPPIIEGNGVSKKILAQRDAFKENGHEVVLCHFVDENGKKYAYLDQNKFFCMGGRILYHIKIYIFFRRLSMHVKKTGYNGIYIRYDKNASAGFIHFLKSIEGFSKRIMEIPTYPYDSEVHNASLYRRLRLWEEKHYREKFRFCVDYMVTFTDDTTIFGVKTLKISNAVDDRTICLRKRYDSKEFEYSFIGVANLAFWHGFDRILYGLKNYYASGGKNKIIFRIVGDGNAAERTRLKKIVEDEKLTDKVIFYSNMSGKELDDLFDISNFAIGCLGCHRKQITTVKSLKNVEYAMRGIPFIYSEINDDFDGKPYILKATPDEAPIDINIIIDFIKNFVYSPSDIRQDVSHLTWEKQMKIVGGYF